MVKVSWIVAHACTYIINIFAGLIFVFVGVTTKCFSLEINPLYSITEAHQKHVVTSMCKLVSQNADPSKLRQIFILYLHAEKF